MRLRAEENPHPRKIREECGTRGIRTDRAPKFVIRKPNYIAFPAKL
jgi:hypothetical protein